MKIICYFIIIICILMVLGWIGAYNNIGPVRFVGGYPGFPEAGAPPTVLAANPSSAQEG